MLTKVPFNCSLLWNWELRCAYSVSLPLPVDVLCDKHPGLNSRNHLRNWRKPHSSVWFQLLSLRFVSTKRVRLLLLLKFYWMDANTGWRCPFKSSSPLTPVNVEGFRRFSGIWGSASLNFSGRYSEICRSGAAAASPSTLPVRTNSSWTSKWANCGATGKVTPPTDKMEEAERDVATPHTNLMQLMFCKNKL